MKIINRFAGTKKHMARAALSLTAAAGLLLATVALADDPTAMAPPVQTDRVYSNDTDTDFEQLTSSTSADSVFNWREIPANQQVPVTRAAFDKGGYQLYDDVGETIVVPFTNQNLYVMKFAESDNGTMYFVNTGSVPILYVPRDGYLDNAAVSGTRWYPFGKDFHPSEPVFLGIAPSWPEFVDLGWYPNECYYGGYWGHRSFVEGGVFLPTIGLFFEIGGDHYYGWHGYHDYVAYHPNYYRISYYNRNYYNWANRPHESLHPFDGGGHPYYAHQAFAGAHGFGGDRGFGGPRGFGGDRNVGNDHGFGGGHTFRGAGSFGGDRGFGRDHNFGGGYPTAATHNGGGHTFQGAGGSGLGDRPVGNDHNSGGNHNFNGDRSYSNDHSIGGGQPAEVNHGGSTGHGFRGGVNSEQDGRGFGGDRTFGGSRSDTPTRNGGAGRGSSGDNRTFTGTRSGSDHAFGGARDDAASHDTVSHDTSSVRGSRDTHDFGGGSRSAPGTGGGGQRASHGGNHDDH